MDPATLTIIVSIIGAVSTVLAHFKAFPLVTQGLTWIANLLGSKPAPSPDPSPVTPVEPAKHPLLAALVAQLEHFIANPNTPGVEEFLALLAKLVSKVAPKAA